MRILIKSLILVISMYSIIPMKHVDWDSESRGKSLYFLPIVGLIISMILSFTYFIFNLFEISLFLKAFLYMILPLVISGGIHMDGYIDTCDAFFSRQVLENKIKILSDPHVGAFGVLSCVVIIIFNYALWLSLLSTEYFNLNTLIIICIGYMISRCLASLVVLKLKKAKKTGLAVVLSDTTTKSSFNINVYIVFYSIIFISLIFILYGFSYAVISFLFTYMYFFIIKKFSYKYFNGVTGDIAGFSLTTFETLWLLFTYIYYGNVYA